ncbi:MAG: ATP-binding protein [Desulfopila sp.]|jgi:PAS domain S-box-containing protein|nr:ATP-binding protein [Desulfopila sp.]
MLKALLGILLLCLTSHNAFAENVMYTHSVLVIHSYHENMQWVQEVQQGIMAELENELGDSADIKIEYMDSKRYVGDLYSSHLTALWRSKYKNNPPDCLIVCDDNALNLVLSIREDIFKNIPLVFCGINSYEPERFSSIKNITGVVEAFDLPGTLDIIKQLQPERKKLFIINDSTTTGQANKKRLEAVSYQYSNHFSFMYSGNVPIAMLESAVSTLAEDTAILLMTFNRDAEDRILRYRDAVRAVRESSSQPIFSVWSFYLGRGIVGGSLVNGNSQGQKAAELCIQILRGQDASQLPIITRSPNLPMFDHHELQRFSISRSLLPQGSVVVNTPATLWHQYRNVILGSILLFALQLLIIAFLIHNIRLRKKSEQNLQENQQNLTTTLQAIGDAVISVDPRYTIVQANPSAAALLGVPLEKLPGQDLPDLLIQLDPLTGLQLAGLVKQCCQTGETVQFLPKTILRPKNQQEKHLSGTCSVIRNIDKRIVGAVIICHDITEREAMQAMLAHSRKMEAIGQLAGGVAHDFNNLLTGISGFAELLSMQLKDEPKKSANALKILSAADRAKDLTRQLLSFARKGKIVSSPVDCHKALRSALGLLERSINKNITLQTRLEAHHPIVTGDPVQLENVFLNLGINSADAMEGGGTLSFITLNETVEEEVSCEFGETLEPGTYLHIMVSDTGCGIEQESRQAIFEPFYTTKENGKGTGLGLSAVLGAMQEHGGRIRLLSEPGVGTEFHLYLPVSGEKTRQATLQSPPQGGSETILVIDDEELVLATAQGLLTELGYHVIPVRGGHAGVEYYRQHHRSIDLVILDMIMPDMDGAACFAQLKEIDQNVNVIISSGFAKTARIEETEKLGARAFLQKPYTALAVSSTIRKVLRPHRENVTQE